MGRVTLLFPISFVNNNYHNNYQQLAWLPGGSFTTRLYSLTEEFTEGVSGR